MCQHLISKKENEFNKRSRWIVLRSSEDDTTKYIYYKGKTTVLLEDTKQPINGSEASK